MRRERTGVVEIDDQLQEILPAERRVERSRHVATRRRHARGGYVRDVMTNTIPKKAGDMISHKPVVAHAGCDTNFITRETLLILSSVLLYMTHENPARCKMNKFLRAEHKSKQDTGHVLQHIGTHREVQNECDVFYRSALATAPFTHRAKETTKHKRHGEENLCTTVST